MAPATTVHITKAVLATVVLVTAIAPLATDMYVPAFPLVTRDLGADPTQVQLTLTTFFVGMALGQLVGGPISDARGRRQHLIIALVVLTLASVACAFAPEIWTMMAARFLQGLSGGWAMVIARAVIVDLAAGADLVRSLNLVSGVGGVAPVVGPLMGGLILLVTDWRVSFWVLTAMSAAMVAAVAIAIPESLPPEKRHSGGLGQLLGATGRVLSNRNYVAYLLITGFSMGATFAYVATSAYILQSMNGLSPMLYSVDFAFNAVGLALLTLVAARLAGIVPTRHVIALGLAGNVVAGLMMLIGALWFDTPLWVALVAFLVLMSSQGFVGPNAGALASDQVPEHPGTGSAVLGFMQWVMAGVIAPIAGLGGDQTAVPMAVIILVLAGLSFVALYLVARPQPDERPSLRGS
ncbi:multidrug effflux MFS transporter [Aestuariimicrobium ganziense]|uniref:multidrug effflux MFS transporter n=1 Tax=Aestuariimicrobium ganziense TaxID=2773677 RepID=UPI00194098B7|nr:multidrug effflux MFS transporter [Aestuariimicrobium ganziense]